MQGAQPFPSLHDGGRALLESIRNLVHGIAGNEDITDTMDLFEAGMDSLQASQLRRAILNGLRVTPNLPGPIRDIEPDFCFDNSSIHKLHSAVTCIMEGAKAAHAAGTTREERRVQAMEVMFAKYMEVLRSFETLTAQVCASRAERGPTVEHKKVVVLTGSTGSLGCFLLAHLASDPDVSRVICLNRAHTAAAPLQRQRDMMEKRGALLSTDARDKVVIHAADLSRHDFGLDEDKFDELLSVTHIVHTAWPANFDWSLCSFEPHIHGLTNLVRLALLSGGRREVGSAPTRILFASSIAVAGRFPSLHAAGPFEVPETFLDATNSAEFGYPEAKWVCERLLLEAAKLYGGAAGLGEPLVQGCNVRIGQMTGPEGSGAWNESEHFPIILRASQQLGALPALQGSLSWLPVNRAGSILTELLFSCGFQSFYHMENPSRQSWEEIMRSLSGILGKHGAPLPLIPLKDWLARVKALGDDPKRNAAFKIMSFLERDFETMASGNVVLCTAMAKVDSVLMEKCAALNQRHIEEYVAYWRSVGAIE
ncbi:hypothetical protein C0992_013352 [Termitomyces sp. T32_za158]|nr:hypothetical protein C0992_013352 [Termitomyces sp. T32_za158]